jgi:aldehyde dehydrogenase (NAD+)
MPFPIPTEKIEYRHYINGEFCESSDKGSFKLSSPYNHEKIVDVCEATVEDTNRAVAAAKAAFPAWADLDPPTRGGYIKKYAQLIRDSINDLAQLDAMAMGRPVSTYFDGKVCADVFEHYSQAGYEARGETSLNTPGM